MVCGLATPETGGIPPGCAMELEAEVVGEQAKEQAAALVDAATTAFATGLDGDVETEPYVVVSMRVPMTVALEFRRLTAGDLDSYWVEPFCRICGCTNSNACEGGCYWVEPDLCSACVSRVPIVLELPTRQAEVLHG